MRSPIPPIENAAKEFAHAHYKAAKRWQYCPYKEVTYAEKAVFQRKSIRKCVFEEC